MSEEIAYQPSDAPSQPEFKPVNLTVDPLDVRQYKSRPQRSQRQIRLADAGSRMRWSDVNPEENWDDIDAERNDQLTNFVNNMRERGYELGDHYNLSLEGTAGQGFVALVGIIRHLDKTHFEMQQDIVDAWPLHALHIRAPLSKIIVTVPTNEARTDDHLAVAGD